MQPHHVYHDAQHCWVLFAQHISCNVRYSGRGCWSIGDARGAQPGVSDGWSLSAVNSAGHVFLVNSVDHLGFLPPQSWSTPPEVWLTLPAAGLGPGFDRIRVEFHQIRVKFTKSGLGRPNLGETLRTRVLGSATIRPVPPCFLWFRPAQGRKRANLGRRRIDCRRCDQVWGDWWHSSAVGIDSRSCPPELADRPCQCWVPTLVPTAEDWTQTPRATYVFGALLYDAGFAHSDFCRQIGPSRRQLDFCQVGNHGHICVGICAAFQTAWVAAGPW